MTWSAVSAVRAAEGLAQVEAAAVGIAVERGQRVGDRLLHAVGRRQRVLVRGELDGVVDARARAPAPRRACPARRARCPRMCSLARDSQGASCGAPYAAGYEPRIFRNWQRSADLGQHRGTSSVSRCPSKSTKLTYSQGRRLVGRDSILVRLSPARRERLEDPVEHAGLVLHREQDRRLVAPGRAHRRGGRGRGSASSCDGLSSMRRRRIGTP